jgi:hypothetical protein
MDRTLIRRIDSMLPHDLRRLAFRLRRPETFHAWQRMRTGADPKGYTFEPFDRHRCIFIHVPKCAGVSMSRALFGNLAGGHRKIDTYRLVFNRAEFTSYFKFAFVRNPWDRLVSAFFYLKNGGFEKSDHTWLEEQLGGISDFDSFVRRGLALPEVLSVALFRPQTHYICSDGEPALDFIGHFESLEHDFRFVQQRLGCRRPLQTLNESRRARDYRDYYSAETRQIVADVYRDDLNALGYRFGQPFTVPQLIRRRIA